MTTWEKFEDLEICDGDSDEWNEFIDYLLDLEKVLFYSSLH